MQNIIVLAKSKSKIDNLPKIEVIFVRQIIFIQLMINYLQISQRFN